MPYRVFYDSRRRGQHHNNKVETQRRRVLKCLRDIIRIERTGLGSEVRAEKVQQTSTIPPYLAGWWSLTHNALQDVAIWWWMSQ